MNRKARVKWACDFEVPPNFRWPNKRESKYVDAHRAAENFAVRNAFLAHRARYLRCGNAFPHWPKPEASSCRFTTPSSQDVLGLENLKRIRSELGSHKILLICGEYAFMACSGIEQRHLSYLEGTELDPSQLDAINRRLNSTFARCWYMGHTRRWTLKTRSAILADISNAGSWSC